MNTGMDDDPDPALDLYGFCRESHEYRQFGRIVPSVTQVLRRAGLVRFWQGPASMAAAMQRGRDVHMVAADIERGAPDYWSAGPLAGYAAAWHGFMADFDYEPTQTEAIVADEKLGFSGTFDSRGWIFAGSAERRRPVLIERKTGGHSAWHDEQIAAYWLALGRPLDCERLLVYLRPTGYTAARPGPMAEYNFRAALAIAQLRIKRKLTADDEIFDQIVATESATSRGADLALSMEGWQ